MNVVARELVDPQTHAYLPADVLRAKFQAVGALDAKRVVTYCGGGIAASSDAFILTLLGRDDVAVYDASLSEWANDPATADGARLASPPGRREVTPTNLARSEERPRSAGRSNTGMGAIRGPPSRQ